MTNIENKELCMELFEGIKAYKNMGVVCTDLAKLDEMIAEVADLGLTSLRNKFNAVKDYAFGVLEVLEIRRKLIKKLKEIDGDDYYSCDHTNSNRLKEAFTILDYCSNKLANQRKVFDFEIERLEEVIKELRLYGIECKELGQRYYFLSLSLNVKKYNG